MEKGQGHYSAFFAEGQPAHDGDAESDGAGFEDAAGDLRA
jgi:hypothetical protein